MKHTLTEYLTIKDQEYKIQFYYTKGGVNYLTGNQNARGYHINVTPVYRKWNEYKTANGTEGGYWSESSIMFNGIKHLVEEASRYSKAKFDALSEDFMDVYENTINGMIAYCEDKGWKVKAD